MPYVVWILFHTRDNLSHPSQHRRLSLVVYIAVYIALEEFEDVQTVARVAEKSRE